MFNFNLFFIFAQFFSINWMIKIIKNSAFFLNENFFLQSVQEFIYTQFVWVNHGVYVVKSIRLTFFTSFVTKVDIINANIIWLYGRIMCAQVQKTRCYWNDKKKSDAKIIQANGSTNYKHTILWAIKFAYIKCSSSTTTKKLLDTHIE